MLRAAAPVLRHLHSAHRSERGQLLIMFVVLFSVVIAMVAFAIDQNFWFGRRRIAETSADLSARAGAIAFFGNTLEPCEVAADAAIQNGIDVANPCDNSPATETLFSEVDFGDIEKCVEARIHTPTRALFSGIFGINDINIGATSRACAGTVDEVYVDADNDGAEGIAVVIGRGSGGSNRDCFTGSGSNRRLDVGRECVIWGALDDSSQHNRLLWTDNEDCYGNITGATSQISSGVAWACEAGTDEAETTEINSVADGGVDQDDVLFAFRTRLQQSSGTNCDKGPDSASFRSAFARADGVDVEAIPPPPFTGAPNGAPRNSIYVQDDCFNNPRIVMLPMSLDSGTSGGDKDVDGFAIVYLTGCYDANASISEPNSQAETNTCSGGSLPNPTSQDDARECNDGPGYTPSAFCRVEIRGVPIRLFITDGALGDLDDFTVTQGVNYPLTIQTVPLQ